MKHRNGVIFDLDGVLVDSYRAHFETWRLLGEEFGNRMTEDRFALLFGRKSPDTIRELWGEDLSPEQVSAMTERKEALYRDLLERDFPAMDGARELIDKLLEKGFLLGVGSSAPPENVELSLRKLGRQESFSAVVTGEDVTRGKPDPEVFLAVARRMDLEPRRCAVIEDAPAGVAAAKAGGIGAAIALTGTVPAEKFDGADYVVDSLRALTPKKIAELIRLSRR